MNDKRFYKRWWFWTITGIGVIIIASIAYGMAAEEDVEMTTQIVERGTFTQTVEVSGELESIEEVELSFDISGTIEQFLVVEGDEVEEGDLLAYLDTTELIADVQNAYQAVKVAQANLDQRKAGSSVEDLAVSQAAVDTAEVSVTAAEVSLINVQSDLVYAQALAEATISSAEASVDTAEDAYNNAVTYYAEQVDQAYDDLLSSYWSALIEVRNAISDADEVLGIRDGTANDDYETVLSNKSIQALTDAKTSFYGAEESLEAVEDNVFELTYDSESTSIEALSDLVEEALDDAADLLLHTRKVVSATVPTINFTTTELSALKDGIDASRNALQTDQATVLAARQAVDSALLSQETEVTAAANGLVEAEENLTKVEATQNSTIATAEASVLTAESTLALRQADLVSTQASYAQTSASPRQVDLSALEAEVERSYAAYNASNARLEKAEIYSPINGKVTNIAFEVGEQIVGATPLMIVQTTEDQFRIIAKVTESDIAKISLNNIASVTFDAFGDDVAIPAFVHEIDLAETLIEGVVYYEVIIYLDGEIILPLKPGMSTDIEIHTIEEQDMIIIPQRAVLTHGSDKYVRILDAEGEIEERTVTVGVRGDLGLILIESGLEEGEEIVIKISD